MNCVPADMLNTVTVSEVLAGLRRLPDACVHCVVTSPPYWTCRDYGTARWEGGTTACDHVERMARRDGGKRTPGGRGGSFAETPIQFSDVCRKCGARRVDEQIGIETELGAYLAKLLEVFREVRRVLRPDGTLWLNLGDVMAGGRARRTDDEEDPFRARHDGTAIHVKRGRASGAGARRTIPRGLKSQDMCMIPARVAMALQADGWWLRAEIVWNKPNPMPDSATTRPARAHEMMYLLASSFDYFYDDIAVRVPEARTWTGENNGRRWASGVTVGKVLGNDDPNSGLVKSGSTDGMRNLRDVWTIASEPSPYEHFACYPERLVEPCVMAGTSERGACAACGAPWLRDVERVRTLDGEPAVDLLPARGTRVNPSTAQGVGHGRIATRIVSRGWEPGCACDAAVVPAVVLDPFAGTGTTGVVARRMGRDFVGFDLNPAFASIARGRLGVLRADESVAGHELPLFAGGKMP